MIDEPVAQPAGDVGLQTLTVVAKGETKSDAVVNPAISA